MQVINNSERWGAISQILHWLVVLLLVTQFVIAAIAEDLPLGMEKLAWLARHKSVGITILGLAIIRLTWRLLSPGPALPDKLKWFERFLASVTHIGLYLVIFLMPLSGWLMSSAKNYPVSWFKLVQLPDMIGKSEEAFEFFKAVHEILAFSLVLLVVLHIAGALKHQFILKDRLMRRMLPGVAVLSLLGALTVTQSYPVRAADMRSEPTESELSFDFTQAGAVTRGEFKDFTLLITDADRGLAGSSLTVVIKVGSLDTNDRERDDILNGPDLFDTRQFQEARFITNTITAKGEGRYEAAGTLTIRDQSRPLVLPLTLKESSEGGTPIMYLEGSVSIRRLDYGVGKGEWESTEWVGNEVELAWSVRLVPGQ